MYDKKGKVEVSAVLDEEELLDVAIEAGIDDFLLEEVSELFEGVEFCVRHSFIYQVNLKILG
jgi:transcriptional/translational regulatory protein YebC/TACO1